MNPAEFQNIERAEAEMWWFRGMRKILDAWVGRLGDSRFERVLEGGCGTGYMSSWLGRRYGWTMFPVDLGWGGLEFGRQHGVLRMTQADISKLPFAEGSFDAVVSLDVLVHFPRGGESAALKEFWRVLRPGGKLILRVSALEILRSRHSTFAHERQRFDRSRLIRGVEEAGFGVLDTSYANSLLMPVALLKFRVWEELTRQEPASGVEVPGKFLNWALEQPLAVEAALLRRGMGMPVGQSLLLLAEKPL